MFILYHALDLIETWVCSIDNKSYLYVSLNLISFCDILVLQTNFFLL